MNKICPSCGRNLDSSMFYKDRTRIDGLSSMCKQCKKKKQKAYRTNNHDKVNVYDRERLEDDNRKKYNKYYQRDYRKYNKIKADRLGVKSNARRKINNLIKINKINKAVVCEVSKSTENVQYHHEDYYFPLIVVALSHNMHEIVHKKKKYNEEIHNKIRSIVNNIFQKRKNRFLEVGEDQYIYEFKEGLI
jgi:hypothetical protein